MNSYQHSAGILNRVGALNGLAATVDEFRAGILDALWDDLRKPKAEADFSELTPVINEIKFALENLKLWASRQPLIPSGQTLGEYSLLPQPIGKVLVISAWNFPFQLSLLPVVNALAAGNEVVLKPSEFAPITAQVIKKISCLLYTSPSPRD